MMTPDGIEEHLKAQDAIIEELREDVRSLLLSRASDEAAEEKEDSLILDRTTRFRFLVTGVGFMLLVVAMDVFTVIVTLTRH